MKGQIQGYLHLEALNLILATLRMSDGGTTNVRTMALAMLTQSSTAKKVAHLRVGCSNASEMLQTLINEYLMQLILE